MIKRWIFYLTALIGLGAFWLILPSRISWSLFSMALWLPCFSLAVSLCPIILSRARLRCPASLPMGADATAELSVSNKLPQPMYRGRLQLSHAFTDTDRAFRDGDELPTDHCGKLLLRCRRFWVYDYLGLFRLPMPRPEDHTVLVMPKPIPMDIAEALQRSLAQGWVPKPGGGFSENHELRLYRPGDSLNRIHWKLTAKVGDLIVREAMVPRCGRFLLTLHISGTPAELDRKLGRLLWLGHHLLTQGLSFAIRATTGDGGLHLQINSEAALEDAMKQLLSAPPATGKDLPGRVSSRHFHIGGEPDET